MAIAEQPAHLLQRGVPSTSKLLRQELTPPLWEMGAVTGLVERDTNIGLNDQISQAYRDQRH